MIALTFDDGVTKKTLDILDILDREQVKATFFVVGETLIERGRLQILKQAHERGHVIGNHTWTHLDLNALPPVRVQEEVLMAQNGIDLNLGAKQRRYLRPPFGEIRQHAYDILADLGYTVVLWTLDLKDWQSSQTSQRLLARFKKELESSDPIKRSILLLLHEKHNTLESLPEMIHSARAKGFKFVTINECIPH